MQKFTCKIGIIPISREEELKKIAVIKYCFKLQSLKSISIARVKVVTTRKKDVGFNGMIHSGNCLGELEV